MNWRKLGLLFSTKWLTPPLYSHAQMPFANVISKDLIRIFFTARNHKGHSLPVYIDLNNLYSTDKAIHSQPFLSLGRPGSFDEHGIMPSCLVHYQHKIYLYYIGWSIGVSVPYRLAIGLATSADGGKTFQKISQGPVLDRSVIDPLFVTTPFVLHENGLWRMWYSSATAWLKSEERLEPVYRIHYAESHDGVHWHPSHTPAIDYQFHGEALARPWVTRWDATYRMWFSARGSKGYRTKNGETYRIAYAESMDGQHWERKKDELSGILLSADGWDSEMLAYASIFDYAEEHYLLYCGNGFGKTGFGVAVLNDD